MIAKCRKLYFFCPGCSGPFVPLAFLTLYFPLFSLAFIYILCIFASPIHLLIISKYSI